MTEDDARKEISRIPADVMKDAAKQAIREWLDELWIAVGKWTAKGLVTFIIGAFFAWILYFMIVTHGFGTISPGAPPK
jgi:hypothetical protein